MISLGAITNKQMKLGFDTEKQITYGQDPYVITYGFYIRQNLYVITYRF